MQKLSEKVKFVPCWKLRILRNKESKQTLPKNKTTGGQMNKLRIIMESLKDVKITINNEKPKKAIELTGSDLKKLYPREDE